MSFFKIYIHTGKLDIFQGDPLIWGDPLISAVGNFPRGPSNLGGPLIREGRVGEKLKIPSYAAVTDLRPDTIVVSKETR